MIESRDVKQGVLRRFSPALLVFFAAVYKLWNDYPTIYQRSEMWAEMATNFFWTAHTASLAQNLITLDYGYLPAIPRLIALATQGLGVAPLYVPLVYTAMTGLITASCFSAFALPVFRPLMVSDLARVAVCFGLMGAPDWETKTLINVAYNTAIPFYLMLLMASTKQTMSVKRGMWTGLALALCALSKPHFIAFVPGIGLLMLLTARRRQVGNTLMLTLALAAIAVQTAILFTHLPQDAQPLPSMAQTLILWGRYQAFVLMTLAGVQQPITVQLTDRVGALLIASIVAGSIYLFRRRPAQDLTLRALAVGSGALVVGFGLAIRANAYLLNDASGVMHSKILIGRHWFIPIVAVFMTFALILQQSKYLLIRGPVFVAWLWMAWPLGLCVEPLEFDWPLTGYSAWQAMVPYSPLGADPNLAHPHYCVPVDPYPWHIGNACDPLVALESLGPLTAGVFVPVEGPFLCPKDVDGRLSQIGLRLQGGERGKRSLIALNAKLEPMGVAKETPTFSNNLTFFIFDSPIAAPFQIRLMEGGDKVTSVVMSPTTGAPQWLWLGVEGVQQAAL